MDALFRTACVDTSVDAAGTSACATSYTWTFFHFPLRKSRMETTASTDSAMQIAKYTPRDCKPVRTAKVHASGIWKIQ